MGVVTNILGDVYGKNLKKLPDIDVLAKKFLKNNPKPHDMAVHKFAVKKGIDIDKFEEALYRVASQKGGK